MSRRLVGVIALSCMLLAAASAQPKGKPSLQAAAKKYFGSWDKDKNGQLSIEELDRVLTNPAVKGEAAAVAAVLRQVATPDKKSDKPPQIDLDFLASGETKQPSLDVRFAAALNRINNADRKLFLGDGPKLDAIHQGGIGDCFVLAPLGAFIARDPKAITKMMSELPNGNIKVQFALRAVEVPPLTDGEFAMAGAFSEHTGCWIRIYEKAVGIYKHETKGEMHSKELSTDIIAHGGSEGATFTILTGHITFRFATAKLHDKKLDNAEQTKLMNELRDRLKYATEHKKLMGLGTPRTVSVPGLTPSHAYAVLSFNSKDDLLTIWNPHGNSFTPQGAEGLENGYIKKDGLFKVPLKDAVQWADGFLFETDKAPPPPKK